MRPPCSQAEASAKGYGRRWKLRRKRKRSEGGKPKTQL